jgi:O-antigen/teichoic acid export membrane protein
MVAKSFLGGVFTVVGGSAVAQAIALASFPFITRLYVPDVYGAFVVFASCAGIVGAVACWRFDAAIALPRRSRSASAVAIGSLALAAMTAALSGLVALAASVFWSYAGGWFPVGIAFYVLLAGAQQVFTNWSARTRDYARLSMSRVAQSSVNAVLAIGLAQVFTAEAQLLVVATLAGQLAALLVLCARLPDSGLAFDMRIHQVKRLLRHFRRIVAFNVPQVLSDAAQSSGIPLAVASLFGAHAAAYYAFSTRLLKAPLNLIGGAISQVYYPRAAEHRNDNIRLRRDALRILKVLGLIALVAQPLLLLLPDAAYTLAFGGLWSGVGAYLRALSPWILASFVVAPMSVLYMVKGRVGLDFALAVGGSVLAFTIMGLVWATSGSAHAAMWALSIGMAVYFVATTVFEFVVVLKVGKNHGA